MTTRLRTRWTTLLSTAVPAALLLVLIPAQAGAVASPGKPAPAWPAGVPRPAAPDCALQGGGTPLTPSSAEWLPGGGYAYDFMIDGVDNQYLVPPPTFRPMTATPAQLSEYGFPSAPAAGPLRSQWMAAMTSFTGVPAPSLCLGTFKVGGAQKAGGAQAAGRASPCTARGSSCLLNWAGFNTHASNDRWVAVEGAWIQARARNCRCKAPTEEVTWAGLGGRYSGSLIQAGTGMANSSLFAWYEYLRTCSAGECGPQIISVGRVTAGAHIFTETSYQRSRRRASFFVSAGHFVYPIRPKILSLAYYNGQSAEWIDERPSHCRGGCYESVTNFLFNNWVDAKAENTRGRFQSVQSQSHVADVMWDGHRVLVQPSRLSGARFRNTWEHAT